MLGEAALGRTRSSHARCNDRHTRAVMVNFGEAEIIIVPRARMRARAPSLVSHSYSEPRKFALRAVCVKGTRDIR